MIDSGLVGLSGRGAARAAGAQETPTQSHISQNILVYEDESPLLLLVHSMPGFRILLELGLPGSVIRHVTLCSFLFTEISPGWEELLIVNKRV